MKSTWVIFGATSIIAEGFARIVARAGHPLLLIARDSASLNIIASDMQIRYGVLCEIMVADFANEQHHLLSLLQKRPDNLCYFIATSDMTENQQLTSEAIKTLISVNIISIVELIHAYLEKKQAEHRLIFLSSVAACRGRSKNSLYGASKNAVEIYLQGLQQAATLSQYFTIVRLGFIDTKQTFGKPGIFYASPPSACARSCWKASYKGKRLVYHPFFWRFIMAIITRMPFALFKYLKI
jgi:short-subunit dehydrogenase